MRLPFNTSDKKKVTESFIQLWEFEALLAEKLYDEALSMMPQIDEDCQEALMAALLIYRELLTVIREKNYQVFSKKNAVSIQRKAFLLRSVKQQIKTNRVKIMQDEILDVAEQLFMQQEV